jgi:hypothetical protein
MIELLTKPAPIDDRTTEPMPAVHADSPELCGVDGCWSVAQPMVYCQSCKRPLCREHSHFGARWIGCPEHKGGE